MCFSYLTLLCKNIQKFKLIYNITIKFIKDYQTNHNPKIFQLSLIYHHRHYLHHLHHYHCHHTHTHTQQQHTHTLT